MKKSDYFVIGVMSGTSLDGIDLAYIHFAVENNYNFEILEAQTVDYSKNWREKLDAAIDLEDDKLQELNKEYTRKSLKRNDSLFNCRGERNQASYSGVQG